MLDEVKVVKRDGSVDIYDKSKIVNAVVKAAQEVDVLGSDSPQTLGLEVADQVEEKLIQGNGNGKVDVETIQDFVEETLIELNEKSVAKRYIIYRYEMAKEREGAWFDLDLAESIWESKYRRLGESFPEFLYRVSNGDKRIQKLLRKKEFCYAGRILANRGMNEKGLKVSYFNCYYIPVEDDSLEGIFNTAYNMARTYSYGGGVGVDISPLRPKGARVNNAAKKTTGSVSFARFYDAVTGLIGQENRRGAGLDFLDVSHPDIEEFIEIKTDTEEMTNTNISVKMDNEFMEKYKNNEKHKLYFDVEDTGEVIEKEISASRLMNKIAYSAWYSGEPGVLFWDRIENWSLMTAHPEFEYGGVNPCGELPLPDYGACALSSVNLSEMVDKPFTDEAEINFDRFRNVVELGIETLDDVIEEGMDTHPLEEQKETAKKWRQIGLGVMGFSDLLIKLGVEYGSQESLDIIDELGSIMINTALRTSAKLAMERGTFPAYTDDIIDSPFIQENATEDTIELIKDYGLRNSSLLSIAPTGSISNLYGVSGGIEPLFDISYTRKAEGMEGGKEYKVFTPVVKDYMKKKGIESEDDLPDYIVSAHDLNPKERVDVQARWQKYIDSSISSTINLPNSATLEDVKDLYVYSHKEGLKGVTVFRDGCVRAGILTSDNSDNEDKIIDLDENDFLEQDVCPECKAEIQHSGGCVLCPNCGWSPCH